MVKLLFFPHSSLKWSTFFSQLFLDSELGGEQMQRMVRNYKKSLIIVENKFEKCAIFIRNFLKNDYSYLKIYLKS